MRRRRVPPPAPSPRWRRQAARARAATRHPAPPARTRPSPRERAPRRRRASDPLARRQPADRARPAPAVCVRRGAPPLSRAGETRRASLPRWTGWRRPRRASMDDLFVAVLVALELDGRVLDRESLAEHRLRLGQDLVMAAALRPFAGDDDVAGERHQA